MTNLVSPIDVFRNSSLDTSIFVPFDDQKS